MISNLNLLNVFRVAYPYASIPISVPPKLPLIKPNVIFFFPTKPRSIIKKGPALDGIPPKVYLVLGHFILQMIITFIENGFFHRDASSAILTVLLKTNKYPSLSSNYRPL